MMNALGIRANEADLKVHLTFHSLSPYYLREFKKKPTFSKNLKKRKYQVYMEAADEEGDENGRIDFPEFLAVMSKVGVKRRPCTECRESYTHKGINIYAFLLRKMSS